MVRSDFLHHCCDASYANGNDLSLSFQGANVSQLERDIGADQFPPNEHYFGLVNVSGVKLL